MWFLFVKFSTRLCVLFFFDKETREWIAQTDLSCALGDTEADKASHNRIDQEFNNKVETDDGDDEDKRILSCPSCFDKGVDIGVLNGLCVEEKDNKERHEEQGVEESSR